MNKDIYPIPQNRKLAVDALQMAVKRPMVHGFLEADVTAPRRILKGTSGTDGRPLSFTAYVIACYARAIHAHPAIQAYRILGNRSIVFHDVDVSTYVEHAGAGGIPSPYVIRSAEMKSVREISEELRSVKAGTHPLGRLEKIIALATHVPRLFRVIFFNIMKYFPELIKLIDGTTSVSSFGMFGKGLRWGVGLLYIHTAGLWVGGIAEKPIAYKGSIALRECLHLTLSIDHSLADGGPAGRFVGTFIEMLESGETLAGEASRT
jgi:pyruvate/2-oxoglutarate dehydrogenase complex dihydrolipoamide acyltransferase (E2) component